MYIFVIINEKRLQYIQQNYHVLPQAITGALIYIFKIYASLALAKRRFYITILITTLCKASEQNWRTR
jgi:hypothetical protein